MITKILKRRKVYRGRNRNAYQGDNVGTYFSKQLLLSPQNKGYSPVIVQAEEAVTRRKQNKFEEV